MNVYLDQRPVVVEAFVGSYLALRGALGVPRGVAVGIVGTAGLVLLGVKENDVAGRNVRAWDFREGDCYRTVDYPTALGHYHLDSEETDPIDWWKERS